MIWRIVSEDMVSFAATLTILLMAFSLASFVCTVKHAERSLTGLMDTVWDFFLASTSGFDKDAHDSNRGTVLIPVMVTYSVLVTITLLNILIAMMNDTYANVKVQAEKQRHMERARVILAIEQEQKASRRPPGSQYWTEIEGENYLINEHISQSWTHDG